jgi:23S rRNA (uracil1939-C5)-methyltransferase
VHVHKRFARQISAIGRWYGRDMFVAVALLNMVPAIMTTLRLTITALAAGGDGVARDSEGRVVFVPRTAPGDVVDVEITMSKSSFARGRVVALHQGGGGRRESICAAFDEGCGGCQWLHIDEKTQRQAKRAIVVNALRAVVDESNVADVVAASPAWGWRRRARVHVDSHSGSVGFFANSSHRVVPLRTCPQLDPRVLATVQNGELNGKEMAVAVDCHGVVATHIIGTDAVGEIEIDPGIWVSVDGFAQASAQGNAALVIDVVASVAAYAKNDARVLELFAGAGNFTQALLAAGAVVTASDIVAPRRWELSSRFVVGSAANIASQFAPHDFDVIVLDPPRAGAKDCVAEIARLSPSCIVYVSCDPATLGRDLQALVAHGYRVAKVTPHDVMPQTAHVETVAVVVRP